MSNKIIKKIKNNNNNKHQHGKKSDSKIIALSLLSFLSMATQASLDKQITDPVEADSEPAIKRLGEIQKDIKLIIDQEDQVVQYWNNWPNWPNWNNWLDWPNWNNWGNW